MKVFLSDSPKTRVGTSVISILCGGVIIGLTSPIAITNVEFFYGFGLAFSQGGGNAAFTAAAAAIVAAAVGGGLMVAAGLVGIAGHFAKSQALLVIFLLLTAIGSLVAVVGGGMFTTVPHMVSEHIYINATNDMIPPLQGLDKDMSDFELAIFNECCVSKNWTEQRAAQVCTGNNTNDCAAITDPILTQIDNVEVLFCSCASSAERLAAFQTAIRDTGLCTKARRAFVEASHLQLPDKVPGNLQLSTLVAQKYQPAIQLLAKIPLVGFQKTSALNPNQAEVAEFPENFGCGFGYMKGIAWMTDIWFQQNAVIPAQAALAIGLVNISFIILAIVISVMQSSEERELGIGKVDKWDAVKDIPATYAGATPNPMHAMVAHVGTSGSVHNSATSSQEQQQQHSSSAHSSNKAEIFEKLRDFYAKYDKDKNLSDVEDVAAWAAANGLDAINAKLMAKYKADLNSVERSGTSNAAMGVGAKALQADLDI